MCANARRIPLATATPNKIAAYRPKRLSGAARYAATPPTQSPIAATWTAMSSWLASGKPGIACAPAPSIRATAAPTPRTGQGDSNANSAHASKAPARRSASRRPKPDARTAIAVSPSKERLASWPSSASGSAAISKITPALTSGRDTAWRRISARYPVTPNASAKPTKCTQRDSAWRTKPSGVAVPNSPAIKDEYGLGLGRRTEKRKAPRDGCVSAASTGQLSTKVPISAELIGAESTRPREVTGRATWRPDGLKTLIPAPAGETGSGKTSSAAGGSFGKIASGGGPDWSSCAWAETV